MAQETQHRGLGKRMFYQGLPEELRTLWPRSTTRLPDGFIDLINAGWSKLSEAERNKLVVKLQNEPDGLERALVAVREATMATFS